MNTAAIALMLSGISIFAAVAQATELPRSTPEQQGVDSGAILSFVQAADAQIDAMHSFMILRHGHVIAEAWWAPYDAQTPHQLYSLSKSFTSTAVGLAIDEGKLNLDDKVLSFFPDDAPAEPSEHLQAMRVRDLLCMGTGHDKEPSVRNDDNWPRAFLAQQVPHQPGTHFLYNTSATFMLSAIVQKVTGQTVLDYLRPRLFDPLGIEAPTWGTNPQGITLGGYGLSIRTEDIARFGQLYLQQGKWNGKTLVPAAWIASATRKQIANGDDSQSDWNQGYGFQFWRCRHDCYRGDGAFGQFCLVMPDQDTVIAITAGTQDMQAVLSLVWDKLLDGLHEDALRENSSALNDLQTALAQLAVAAPRGKAQRGVKWADQTYHFAANPQQFSEISLSAGPEDSVVIAFRTGEEQQQIVCGAGRWMPGHLQWRTPQNQAIAASGAWIADDTYQAKICFLESPASSQWTLKFSDGQIQLETTDRATFGPAKLPPVIGTLSR